MERLSTTPFGQRPVTAGLLKAVARMAEDTPTLPAVDKWHILRELCAARTAFGLTDREIGVLEGLLSFLPDQMLGGNGDMIVFPSNRALGERCHGMAESTLRRHLARLVEAGVILRHDSPNGKRYATRDHDGAVVRAFGFDLTPLHHRSAEIAQAAQAARDASARFKALRERVSLRKRDAQKLALYGQDQGYRGDWQKILATLLDVTRSMRRQLSFSDLEEIEEQVDDLLGEVLKFVSKAKEMSGNDVSSERHHQNSNTNTTDLELCLEKSKAAEVEAQEPKPVTDGTDSKDSDQEHTLPLPLVIKALPEACAYATNGIRNFDDLARLGASLRGMIGISPSAWHDAVAQMGPVTAGLTICCLTERIHDIRSPGGYLRALTREAAEGRFSITRLIMARLNTAPDS
ncbi:plasmid replication protein RepC [Tateyamaria sp. ANG-S1]|uniref:plasmid replication protein RepC n=1 Tax=Tateyamaria sp. ANG-S1 TaxID=1577905 RepID=UPI00057F1B8F|nr:plasmid replication protein RepC [Tateyamaria sp. ANG-S1]KIC47765.1 hypothetical protein RA29_19345 [Tateyamaria sp. ANG-S1]